MAAMYRRLTFGVKRALASLPPCCVRLSFLHTSSRTNVLHDVSHFVGKPFRQ